MGIKSTTELARSEAITRVVDFSLEKMRRSLEERYAAFSDQDLENLLEELSDEAAGGQGFDNFQIVGE